MNNPVTLVVGAGDYIGAAICKSFAAECYIVVVVRRRNENKRQALVDELISTDSIHRSLLAFTSTTARRLDV